MKKRVLLLALVIVMILGLALAGCNRGGKSGGGSGGGSGVKIGYIPFEMANAYWILIEQGLKEKCDALGWELITDDPKGDAANQITAMENFISMKVDAIVLASLDPASAAPIVKEAVDKGIIVMAQSMDVETASVWVSASEYDMGHVVGVAAGEWIRDKLGGKADVAVISYDVIPQMVNRKIGILEGIAENAPDANIVATQDGVTTEEGLAIMENVLQAHPTIKVIATINDSSALGALAALDASGIDQTDFFIGGVDKLDEAVAKMKDGGPYRMSCDNVPYENGKMNIDVLVKLMDGETMEHYVPVPVVAYTQEMAMKG